MTTLAPEDRNCVLVPSQRMRATTRLPLVDPPFEWHNDDQLRRILAELRFGMKGYRKGQAPGNKGKDYSYEPIPSDEEFQAVMDQCDRRRMCGKRNFAHYNFLRGTGLRIQESLDFLPTDLDPDRGTVLVRCGKGGKRAPCGITPHALRVTLEWMDERTAAGYTSQQPLFCVVEGGSKGGAMNQAYVRAALRRYADKAGVTKRVHPHAFRHALALDMARRRIPLPVISRQLRHSNVATTATYLRKLSDDEVFETVAAMDWQVASAETPERAMAGASRQELLAQIEALQAQLAVAEEFA